MPHRSLTEAERTAWSDYARHVTAFPGRATPAPIPSPLLPSRLTQTSPAAIPKPKITALLPPVATGERPTAGIDDATWTRLRTGKLRPERTLDLHGQTAQRAFHSLDAFLHQAQAHRLRCVEIITGRGTGESGGVLRRELPLWLNLPALRPYILALTHPHAANAGSIRVLLRRQRLRPGS